MPTSPEIFATLEQPLDEAAVRQLASHLSDALGHDAVLTDGGKGAIIVESASDYHLLPDPLPRTETILSVRLSTPYYGDQKSQQRSSSFSTGCHGQEFGMVQMAPKS